MRKAFEKHPVQILLKSGHDFFLFNSQHIGN